ncbi:MAG: 30S ribosomal protein S7 [bacterium]
MPRKELKPRERRAHPGPDPKYNSELVSRLINKLFLKGKKSTIETIFSKCMDIIKERTKEDPINVFTRAIDNVRPLLEVKPRRVGGATYQVPVEVRTDRGITLAMRWIISNARSKKGKSMMEKLAEELIAASRREGTSIKKREDTHKMAEANKAFAHYRW